MISISVLMLIVVPLITAAIIPLFDIFNRNFKRIIVVLSSLIEFLIALNLLIGNFTRLKAQEITLMYNTGWGFPFYTIHLRLDSLGLLFSVFSSLTLCLIIIYSVTVKELKTAQQKGFYIMLFFVIAMMQGTILTGDILNIFIFFELMALISAPLIAYENNEISTDAAIKYIIYGLIGGVFFLLGIIFIWLNLNTLDMCEIAANFGQIAHGIQLSIIICFLLALFIKLGIFPFHFWIPLAHSACPSSISALLSGVILEIYLYIFLRIFWFVIGFNFIQNAGLDTFIMGLGLFSSLIGHFFALQADDIKRMLAFSTVGNIGLIMAVFALNTEVALYAGLLHVFAHMLMKATLFTGTGYLLKFTPSHFFKDFKGVAHKNNGVFISCIVAMLGMIGLPPLIGFISKWYIVLAFLETNHYIGTAVVILGSIISVIYYFRFVSYGYDSDIKNNFAEEEKTVNDFYNKNIVKYMIYIFAGLIVLTGVFCKILDIPLKAAIKVLMSAGNYLVLGLGG